jgi:hypothetical protein
MVGGIDITPCVLGTERNQNHARGEGFHKISKERVQGGCGCNYKLKQVNTTIRTRSGVVIEISYVSTYPDHIHIEVDT